MLEVTTFINPSAPAPEGRCVEGDKPQGREGETIALVGASGAGKTTLLHLMGTLDRPQRARCFRHDDMFQMSDKVLAQFGTLHRFCVQFLPASRIHRTGERPVHYCSGKKKDEAENCAVLLGM
jgi:lipoprotein-releasing system ATP-binding protein